MRALRAARFVDSPDWLITAGAIRTAVWDHLHGFAPPAPSEAPPPLTPSPPAPSLPAAAAPSPPTPASPPAATPSPAAATPASPPDATPASPPDATASPLAATASPSADSPPARPPASLADIDVAFFDAADLSPARDAAVEAALRQVAPDLPWQAKNQAAVHLWYPRKFGLAVAPFTSSADAVATFPETATCVALHLDAADRLTVIAPYGLDDLFGLVHRHNPRRVPAELYERRLAQKRIAERWPRVTVLPAATPGSRAGSPPRGTSPPR